MDLQQHKDCEMLLVQESRVKVALPEQPTVPAGLESDTGITLSSRFPCLVSFDFSRKMVVFEERDDIWVPLSSACGRCDHLPPGKEKLPFYCP